MLRCQFCQDVGLGLGLLFDEDVDGLEMGCDRVCNYLQVLMDV